MKKNANVVTRTIQQLTITALQGYNIQILCSQPALFSQPGNQLMQL